MTKFCPECGFKQHDENNRFCSNCGFDFSGLEENIDSKVSDDSSVNVPITSDSDDSGSSGSGVVSSGSSGSGVVSSGSSGSGVVSSGSSGSGVVSSGSSGSGVVSSGSSGSAKVSSSSTGSPRSATKSNSKPKYKTKTVNNLDGLFSNLSFNKCFLAFAVLLIILVIIGMLSQTTQEPYSDKGLTSFMESSDHYGLYDFLEDTSSDDYYYDYLSYGGDGESSIPGSVNGWLTGVNNEICSIVLRWKR